MHDDDEADDETILPYDESAKDRLVLIIEILLEYSLEFQRVIWP